MPRHARSSTVDSGVAESPTKWLRTNTPEPQSHSSEDLYNIINIIKLEGILFRKDIKKELWDCLKEILWDAEELLVEGTILSCILGRFCDTTGPEMDMKSFTAQLNAWIYSDDQHDIMTLESLLGLYLVVVVSVFGCRNRL